MDDEFPEPDDNALAAFALIDAVNWVAGGLRGEYDAALAAALDAEPEIALAALLKVGERLAVLAGEYANDADETPLEAALRLLEGVRQDFGRQGS